MTESADRTPRWMYALMAVTAAGITAAAILYRQSFLRVLPLYFSLIIALLQARAYRASYLMGSLNSLLYAVVFFHYRLYGSVAQSLLVSCPIQAVTFFLWSRRAYGSSTVFRRLTGKQRAWVAAGFAALCAGVFAVLSAAGSQYRVLDTLVTLMGLLVPALTLFAFVEYAPLMIVNCVMILALYIQMLGQYPEQMTYVIFGVYSLICGVIGFFRVRELYARQQKEEKA